MKIIYGLKGIKRYKKPVVALGVFDGVHRGHRYILKETVKKAKDINGTSIVATFYPHPQDKQSLYSLKHRLRLIAESGIDVCIVIRFNRAFASISAVDFIRDILAAKVGAYFIYIGKNFRFGKSAKGDLGLLKKLSAAHNYKVKAFDVIKINHQPVSSTYIRKLITEGNLALARKMLCRPVTVLGTVVRGISLARQIGFPTANIDPHHEILPPSGVYIVKVNLNNKIFNGICNIGRKPTLLNYRLPPAVRRAQKHIEVYIFGFNKNIYGKDLEIEFIRKIREEKKFTSIEFLAGQIKKDIKQAEDTLSRH